MPSLAGFILQRRNWIKGRIAWRGTEFSEVVGSQVARPVGDQPRIVPGYIDLHVHGGGGGNFSEGTSAVLTAARFHARHGTVALAPTLMTAPLEQMRAGLTGLASARRQVASDGAQLLGAHMEGPFISRQRLGAQPDCVRLPDADLVAHLARIYPIGIMTMAPELPGALAVISVLVGLGIRIQIGHSNATCAQACAGMRAGAQGFTHLFNAMSPFSHRDGGVVAAALGYGREAEIIGDGHHVDDAALRTAKRALTRLYAITDATAAAGMPAGKYKLGGREIVTTGTRALLAGSTTLAGGVVSMHDIRARLLGSGLSVFETAAMMSSIPAGCIGEQESRGLLTAGRRADLVVLSASDEIMEVIIGGQSAFKI